MDKPQVDYFCNKCGYFGRTSKHEGCDYFACTSLIQQYADQLEAENARLKEELETERMRLAACGVAALGYFDGCKDEYRSASLDDVLRLREELAAAQLDAARLSWVENKTTLHEAVEFLYVVDGYDCYLTYDGNVKKEYHGDSIRRAIDSAMKGEQS